MGLGDSAGLKAVEDLKSVIDHAIEKLKEFLSSMRITFDKPPQP